MLRAAISRRQSRVAAKHVHDYASISGDFRIVAGPIGFGSEWGARLFRDDQSTFACGLCEFVSAVERRTSFANHHHALSNGKPFARRDNGGNTNSHHCDADDYSDHDCAGQEIKTAEEAKAVVEE